MVSYFFDLDGTIIDPKSGMIGAFRIALQELGHPDLAKSKLDWIIGPPVLTSFEAVLPRRSEAAEALRIYRQYYRPDGLLFDFSVYPDILDSIADLRKTGSVFVCTMKPEVLAEPILEKLQLKIGLYGADIAGKIEAKEQILARAIAALALDPSTCVVIGDRGSDMVAANKIGMTALGVTWGYGTAIELGEAGAAALCHSPADLPEAVNGCLHQQARPTVCDTR